MADGVAIFGLSFGRGADWNFIKALSVQNDGIARKVFEDSDADIQVLFYI